MDDFREAMKQWILRAVNKGSFDKYFVYPDVDPVLQKYFDCEPVTKGLRYTRWIDGETYQVDVFILIAEVSFNRFMEVTGCQNYLFHSVKFEIIKHIFQERATVDRSHSFGKTRNGLCQTCA